MSFKTLLTGNLWVNPSTPGSGMGHMYLTCEFHGSGTGQRYVTHGSKSRSRPSIRRAQRWIDLGVSDQTRAIHAKHYIKTKKNLKKPRQIQKNVNIYIHVSHIQNLSPSTLNIKRKYKYTHRRYKYCLLYTSPSPRDS